MKDRNVWSDTMKEAQHFDKLGVDSKIRLKWTYRIQWRNLMITASKCWVNLSKPSGFCTYHLFQKSKIPQSVHRIYF
jgi:hypothetical protein